MTDIPDDVRKAAEAVAADQNPATVEDGIAAGIVAERERIAIWHETQADALQAAIDQVMQEGGVIETSRRSLVDLHRGFASAIRKGAV